MLSDNPVAYWRMAQPAKTLIDEKGVANGDIWGTPVDGQPGAIVGDSNASTGFTGGEFGDLSNYTSMFKTPRFTVEAWFNVVPGVTGTKAIYTLVDSGTRLELIDGKPTGRSYWAVDNFAEVTASTSFADGNWHHIAFTHDDSALRLYVDGGVVGYAPMPDATYYGPTFMVPSIGRQPFAPAGENDYRFVGRLDEVAYYDHALSQQQLLTHFTTAGYAVSPVGGSINPSENPCACSPGTPNLGTTQPSVDMPVNTATGNFWHTFEGMSVPGRGMALNFKPTYSSQSASRDGPLGFGWTHSYAASLAVAANGVVTIRQENTAELTFTPAGAGYSAPPRVTASLTHDTSTGTFVLTRNATDSLIFDAAGRLLSLKDGNGELTTLAYTAGQLTTITDPAQRTLTLGYLNGRISTVTDTASPPRVLRFAYYSNGDLSDLTDVAGGVTHFTYDAHRMTTMLNPNQAGSTSPVPMTNHYDGAGRVDWQSDFLARKTTFDYSTPGATKVTDPKGNVTVYRYQFGLLKSLTRAPGTAHEAVWSYEYDPASLGVLSVTDPNKHTTTMTYDGRGNRLSVTDPLSHTTTYTYGSFDNVTSVTDAKKVTTTLNYVGTNLKTTSTPIVPGTGSRVVTLNYDDPAHKGDATSMVDANNKTWTYTYTANGDLTSVTDPVTPVHGTTRFCYDGIGRRTAVISPNGTAAGVTCTSARPAPYTTYYSYNALGQVRSVTDPLGHTSSQDYDLDGNLAWADDALLNHTRYDYDSADQLRTVTRADTTTLTYQYWEDGTVKKVTDGATNPTTYAYDELGRLSTETDPDGRTTTYGYDPAGNVVTKADPGGTCPTWPITYPPALSANARCTVRGYDAADRLTSVTYSDPLTPGVTRIDYDEVNQRTGMVDGTGTSSWTWNSVHDLTQSKDGAGAVTGYGHDPAGRLTSITYPGATGTVQRTYDEAGRLKTVTDWATRQTQFGYDPDGFTKTETFPAATNTVDTFTPDGADRLMSSTVKTGTTTLASFTYTRDNADQLKSLTATGVPADTHSYLYTKLNQLQAVDKANYGYDAADNLTGLSTGTTQAFDPANQLCWAGTASGTPSCASPPAGATTYSYDSRGNRTAMAPPGQTPTGYTWDQANRLAKVTAGGNQGEYTPLTPARILDTRLGQGVCSASTCTTLGPGQTLTLKVAGQGGVPASGAGAAVLNLVVTNTTAGGYLTAWPSDAAQPGTSNLNWAPAQTVSNLAVVKLAADGTVKLYNAAGSTDVVVDVSGWYAKADGTTGSGFNALNAARILDTRVGQGSCPPATCTTVGPGSTLKLAVAGQGGVPASGAAAVAVNLTVTNATTGGWLTTWASNEARPASSSMNFAAGATVSELVLAKLAPDGTVSIYNAQGSVDVIADVSGWYAEGTGAAFQPLSGSRILDTRAGVNAGSCNGTCQTIPAGGTLVLHVASQGGVPATGATAVALNVTAINSPAAGYLTMWPSDQARPYAAQLTYAANQIVANAAIVKLAGDGTISIYAPTGPVDVIIDVAGYYQQPATSASYAYNGDGLRASKTVGGATKAFTWDVAQGQPLALTDGDRTFVYGAGGLPLEQIDAAGNVVYFHQDQLGSTRVLTNATGATVGAFTYDPYGKLNGTSGTVTTPLGFAGEYRDAETGFVYLRVRYYDPATGQFVSRDPLTATTGSAYGYGYDDPLNLTDPAGLDASIVVYPGANGPLITPPFVDVWGGRNLDPPIVDVAGGRLITPPYIEIGAGRLITPPYQAGRDCLASDEAPPAGSPAHGGGKNDPHGDAGRRGQTLEEQIAQLQAQLAELTRTQGPRAEKVKTQNKIRNLEEEARQAAKGETHSRRPK